MTKGPELFPVITAADWGRSIAQARIARNLVREKIRQKCAEVRRDRKAKS